MAVVFAEIGLRVIKMNSKIVVIVMLLNRRLYWYFGAMKRSEMDLGDLILT